MNELRELLKLHYDLYPDIQIKDAVKLIYQNEFGGGHLIKDENASLEYLMEELTKIENSNDNLITDIGNGMIRFNLAALKNCGITPVTLNRLFVISANNRKGSMNKFMEKLNLVYDLPFNNDDVQKYLKKYAEAGYPAVSHSEIYRKTYTPAYRVIDKKYIKLLDLLSMIDRKSESKSKVIIGIDGKCGSGKSTAAAILSEVYGCDVVHMDDFFLPSEFRTDSRLNEIGGNFHYERFKEEVADKIKSSKPFKYRIFDCSVMEYNGTRTIQARPQNIIIVEGSYSLRQRKIYDIKVFIDVPDTIQKQRILARDGEFMWDKFENIWIPMENKYFDEFKIKEVSDIVIEGI